MGNRALAQEKSYQLARYYLKRLKNISAAYRRGHENSTFALATFDQDWPQIKHWWQWVHLHADTDAQVAQLVLDFSLQGEEIFLFRFTPQEYLEWAEASLGVARKTRNRQIEVVCLRRIAWIMHKLARSDEAETTAYQALALAESLGDLLSVGRVLGLLGEIITRKGTYAESWDLSSRSLRMLLAFGAETYLPEVYRTLGDICYLQGDFEGAFKYGFQALSILEARGLNASFIYNFLGALACEYGDYELGERYLLRCLANSQQRNDQSQLAIVLIWLGLLELGRQNYSEAAKHFQESLQMAQSLGEAWVIPAIEVEQGYLFYQMNLWEAAKHKLSQSIASARQYGYRGLLSEALLYFAEANIASNHLDLAQSALLEGITIAYEDKQTLEVTRGLMVAAQFAQRCGHPQQAVERLGLLTTQRGVISTVFDAASHLYSQVAEAFDSQQLNKWFQRGKMLDLDAVIESIIQELSYIAAVEFN
ncbi:MAG: tetratricopeptide repeat protein [Chloroflexi bacterium]|nr:tetratricopeptide repeat protein [Chloroflexota bacterium]